MIDFIYLYFLLIKYVYEDKLNVDRSFLCNLVVKIQRNVSTANEKRGEILAPSELNRQNIIDLA